MIFPGVMWAQSTADDNSAALEDDTTIYLNPFIIDAEQDEGYVAQNAASGSRLSASLKDTPAPISVFTAEFMNDIAATDLSALSDYVVNTERIPGFQNGLASGSNQVEFDTQFRIRGLPASSNTGRSVNFFKYPLAVDSFNLERVEFARGPNSILFGVAAAAGNFNVSTKKARLDRDRIEVSFRTDEYDQARVALDVNQTLVDGRWALRLNALRDRENSWRPFEHKDADRFAVATKWQITPSTVLDLEYETGDVDQSRLVPWAGLDRTTAYFAAGQPTYGGFPPAPGPGLELVRTNYFVYDTDTGTLTDWRNTAVSAMASHPDWNAPFVPPDQQILLSDFSIIPKEAAIAGSGYGNVVDYDTFTATLQQRVTDDLNLELAFNRVEDSYLSNALTPLDITVFWDPNLELPDGSPNPNVGRPFVEGSNGIRLREELAEDLRFTAAYDLDLGKVFGRHQLAGLVEHRMEETMRNATIEKIADPGSPALRGNPDNRANNIKRRTYIDLNGPLEGIAIPDWNDTVVAGTVQYPSQNGVYDYRSEFDSLMIAAQSHFWENRIVTTLGYREDKADFYDSESMRTGAPLGAYTVGTWEAVRNTTPDKYKAVTRSQGVVFHATDKISVFYNHASNFALPNPQLIIFPGDRGPPPPRGESDDWGVKFSLFEGKVFATVTRYETSARDDADFGLVTGNNNINDIWSTFEMNGVLADVLADLNMDTSLTASDLRVNAGGNTFDSDSKGWEFELVANPTRSLRLSLNFSDNKTVRTNIGKDVLAYADLRAAAWTSGDRGGYVINTVGAPITPSDPADGLTTVAETLDTLYGGIESTLVRPEGARYLGSPTQSANLRANYMFREGSLKGFSVGGGVRWRGESVVGYTSSDPATRELINGDAYTLVDFNLGYRRNFALFGKDTKWSIQFNVNNVFDEDDLIPTETFADGTLRQYVFQTPRKWILSTKFEF